MNICVYLTIILKSMQGDNFVDTGPNVGKLDLLSSASADK